ncbi:MAG: hypothetical protein ABI867_43605 [Kofleriaceae bacterium]
MPRARWFALWFVLMSSCFGNCSGPPSRLSHAPNVAPDDEAEGPGVHAFRVLRWNCTDRGNRVYIYRRCAEGCTGCGSWELEEQRCDAPLTELEQRLDATIRDGHAIPDGMGWK